jgi:aspartate/methionine/tyrosine aminotransferase
LVSELHRRGTRILDLSAGRATEPSPGYINQATCNAMLAGDVPDPVQGKPEYGEGIARKLREENGVSVDPDQNLVATLGCKNGPTLALMAIINPGDKVVVEDPCFVSYGTTIGFVGGVTVPAPLRAENGFRWSRSLRHAWSSSSTW